MPTQCTVVTGLVAGPVTAAADVTGNYFIPADGRQKFAVWLFNGTGAAITVTLDDVNSVAPDGGTTFNPDVQITVNAGANRMLLISDSSRFLNPATGRITMTPSAAGAFQFAVYGL